MVTTRSTDMKRAESASKDLQHLQAVLGAGDIETEQTTGGLRVFKRKLDCGVSLEVCFDCFSVQIGVAT